uniref:Pectin acetylesterase n=1 Tax=Lotharella oceanica TaxID=641309 RepID=A0A7S2X7J1_9EUKA
MSPMWLLLVCAMGPAAADGDLTLHLIDQDLADQRGAYCLDGSRPGFYYAPATSVELNTTWIIYLQGGGFCADNDDCADRSTTDLGSSSTWDKTMSGSSVIDSDSSINPLFADAHRVYIPYCDGWFFSGNKDDPVVVNGKTIYFRGKRNLVAVLDTLDPLGLWDVENLMLSGCSAGALADYMQGDYMGDRYADAQKFGIAPLSGFFPVHASKAGDYDFIAQLLISSKLHNVTGGFDGNKCYEAAQRGEISNPHFCGLSNYSYAYMTSNIFMINSALDAYSLQNIYDGDTDCQHDEFNDCSMKQISDFDAWESDFLAQVEMASQFTKDGNGAFIESCLEHCAAEDSKTFASLSIDGLTISQALQQWWESNGADPAADHTYTPCTLKKLGEHQCNPTCPNQENYMEISRMKKRNVPSTPHAYDTPMGH